MTCLTLCGASSDSKYQYKYIGDSLDYIVSRHFLLLIQLCEENTAKYKSKHVNNSKITEKSATTNTNTNTNSNSNINAAMGFSPFLDLFLCWNLCGDPSQQIHGRCAYRTIGTTATRSTSNGASSPTTATTTTTTTNDTISTKHHVRVCLWGSSSLPEGIFEYV